MSLQDDVVDQIKQCYDPEIPVNVYDLGLVYDIEIDGDCVLVQMTFTSEACPSAREIPVDIRNRVCSLDKVNRCDFEIVWDPAWHPSMISEEARKELGIDEDALNA
ncbi:MAG TPA: FeS assembly SUF system protein [Deltaproteobacteria bacterium]|nr:FeS assembly SUF system protein [Deltaproteobacteria bacterium]HCP45925.1 FeS assembly SUF system protein [Deltaproteobacteria bacterium]|tara:strand:- start:206 stop:523 length:318 start_codon:yes stop_codon:yes gene_type:complete